MPFKHPELVDAATQASAERNAAQLGHGKWAMVHYRYGPYPHRWPTAEREEYERLEREAAKAWAALHNAQLVVD
ncbi:hypothetical protein [Caudoviricetes sp.]|nr:hypothetical protein [Caudoviricetes sp.]